MQNIAYNDWIQLYDEDIEDTWHSQHVDLRKAAMVLKVLDKEFKRIRIHLEDEFTLYKEKIKNIEEHKQEEIKSEETTRNDKENKAQNYASPDVFLGNDSPILQPLNDSTNLDIGNIVHTSDEDTSSNISFSPKINRLRRFKRTKQCNNSNYRALELNLSSPNKNETANVNSIDSTIIETTPEILRTPRKVKHRYTDRTGSKGKFKRTLTNSSITQMFFPIASSTKTEDRSPDATYCPQELEIGNPYSAITYVEKDQEMKQPELKKQEFVFKEPPVRGKARLLLEGWDCAECCKFYRELELNTEATKKVLNKCSRHRSRFKPDNYTPKGFWDLGFPPTQSPKNKNSSDSTYFQY